MTTFKHLGTIVGLRPYRRTGFRVEAETRNDKLVIHNYGHGGCGVTLSWGTAEMAADLVVDNRVAVLGAGAVGLATARVLQERGVRVTIYARDLPPNTTSNIAGALWTPVTLADPAVVTAAFRDALIRASRTSHAKFESMLGERYGVRWLPVKWISSTCVAMPWELECTPELNTASMLFIEPDVYLAAVLQDFRDAGGEVVVRDVHDFSEIPERVIVNCTGVGAKALTNDTDLTAVKGQLELVENCDRFDEAVISCDEDLYVLPRRDNLVLGGSHREDDWSLEPNADDTERILRACPALLAGR